MNTDPSPGTRDTDDTGAHARALGTAAVLGLTLISRLLVLWSVHHRFAPTWFFTRGIEMGLLAKSLLGGQGLASPFGGSTGPTAFIAPGYPVLTAAVFRIWGVGTPASAMTLMLLQIAVSLLTIWLIMHLCRRLFDEAVAVVAGLLWACSPPLLYLFTIFWDTTLSVCVLLGLLALALRCARKPSPALWIGIGGLCGLAALLNPSMIPTDASVIGWTTWSAFSAAARTRRSFRGPLLCAATFLVVFSPWPIRNATIFHAFVPLRTTVGFEMWMGNREGASGYLEENLFPMYNRAELEEYKRVGELAYTGNKSHLALAYISSHPGAFTAMSARRFFRFWTGTGTKDGSPIFALHAVATTLFGLLGLWRLWKRSRGAAVLLALPLLLYPIPYYVTHAEFRYRMGIDAVLAVLSAYAIVGLWRVLLQRATYEEQERVEELTEQVLV